MFPKLSALKKEPAFLTAELLLAKLHSKDLAEISEAIDYLDFSKNPTGDFQKNLRKIFYYLLMNKREDFKLFLDKLAEYSSLEFTCALLDFVSGNEFGPILDFIKVWNNPYAVNRYLH